MKLDLQNAILLILCLVLLLGVFTLSANAADTVTELVPIYTNQATTSGFVFGRNGGGNDLYAFRSADVPVYMFAVGTSVYFVSESTTSVRWGSRNNSVPNTLNLTLSYDNIYHYNATGVASTTLPSYLTVDSGMSAVSDYIETVNNPPRPLEYSLPPGNIAFIKVPVGASYTLKTRMPESVLGNNHYPGNNQVLTLVNALPTGGSAPSSPLIPWQQDGALSVLGLSRNASYTGTNASAGYLTIVNPLYYSGTANGPYEFLSNGSIDITIDSQSGLWVYPLDSTLGFTSGLGINVDTEIINDPYTGTVDPDTGVITWVDGDGGSTAPTTGGGNLVSTSETIFDFLRNIADEISTFLKGPIQAIQTVVAAIRQFLGSFTQLYMWLPSPVYNLITSALMIALTIGVIKIFV